MRPKITECAFLVLLSMIPLLWFRAGFVVAKGDYLPWLDPRNAFDTDTYLWASENMGGASTISSFLLDELLWSVLWSVGFTVGLIQIVSQIFLFLVTGFSIYYLSRIVYPRLKLSALISSIFYMFNFFVLQTRLDRGLSWTYAFLPLLAGLLIEVIQTTREKRNETANKKIVYFAIISTITLSVASINPANIVLVSLILVIVFILHVAPKFEIRPLLANITKLLVISILLNLWWAVGILNYYFLSPSTPNPQISVSAWSWTHGRASFINLFWLNGVWGWSPQYFPYYDSYSNPALILLTFFPFILAAAALLFKSDKSRFNACLMLSILTLVFLAKGLHEPFSELSLLLYSVIPNMAIFRESASKFTLAFMPFLALLIGYAVDHIADNQISKYVPHKLTKILITGFFIIVLIAGSYPLILNPIETKTAQLPFSSYVQIPKYWYDAAYWLNSQNGAFRVLMTPPDDFYQMPYTWGYYGTDQISARLVRRPTLSLYYSYSYKTNPNITATLQQLSNTIKYNRTTEFKAFLDILNIRYIVQRNDIQYNFSERDIISPGDMRTFLNQQPYIHLSQKFGELDLYEYDEPKPYIYIVSPAELGQTTVKIENTDIVQRSWDFARLTDVQEWANATQPSQWEINYTITQDNDSLKAELSNSTWGWKTISSPLLPVRDITQIQTDIRGENAHQVHVKTAEYDINRKIVAVTYSAYVGDGNFDLTHISFTFEPTNRATKYLQVQIWHGHETDKPFPNTIWIDQLRVYSYNKALSTTGISQIFQDATQEQPAIIMNYTKPNPTRIQAAIDAAHPFELVVSEALDRSWIAYVNGKEITPDTVYLGLTGFYIDQTGQLEITIEYQPQRWFNYSSMMSATFFLGCFAYLTYRWNQNKATWKRIKAIFGSATRKSFNRRTKEV